MWPRQPMLQGGPSSAHLWSRRARDAVTAAESICVKGYGLGKQARFPVRSAAENRWSIPLLTDLHIL